MICINDSHLSFEPFGVMFSFATMLKRRQKSSPVSPLLVGRASSVPERMMGLLRGMGSEKATFPGRANTGVIGVIGASRGWGEEGGPEGEGELGKGAL